MTPRIASLGHVGIFVEDVDRSLAFYRDLLGLTLTDADEANGMYFLSSRPGEEHHEFLVCRGRTAPRDVYDPDHNRCEVDRPTGLQARQTLLHN